MYLPSADPSYPLIDPANRALELVSEKDNKLKKDVMFEVYEESGMFSRYRGESTEPHDVESGDLDGDGIGDIVVLVHDKLLIYLGDD